MRMIFVNIPIRDVEATRSFFSAIGFTFNPAFSDDRTLCMVVEENIFYMLMTYERFADFVPGKIADPAEGTQALYALSMGSRAEVDDILAKALAAGGKPWRPTEDMGFMYGASFQDINGHVWELTWMDPAAIPHE